MSGDGKVELVERMEIPSRGEDTGQKSRLQELKTVSG